MNITYYEHRLNLIKNLPENWDGFGASVVSNNILEKCKCFLLRIPNVFIDVKDIVPTPYGTLTIDIYNQNNECISVEIGENGFAFFTLFADKTKDKMVECTPNLEDFLQKLNESLFLLLPEILHLLGNHIFQTSKTLEGEAYNTLISSWAESLKNTSSIDGML